MMTYLWSAAATLLVLGAEAAFVRVGSYWAWAWLFIPWAVVINLVIFHLVRSAPSLASAFVVFSAANLIGRTGLSVAMGQPVGRGTWAAVGLGLVALWAREWWGR